MSQDKETWTLIGSGYISTARFFSTDFHPLSRGELKKNRICFFYSEKAQLLGDQAGSRLRKPSVIFRVTWYGASPKSPLERDGAPAPGCVILLRGVARSRRDVLVENHCE